MRRSALPNAYAAYRSDTRVWSDLDSYLATSNNRWTRGLLRSDLSRSPGLVLNSFGEPGGHGPNTSLLVTYNINNGVQLMGRPVEPPPYEEVAAAGHGNRDEPPPPYVSRENLSSTSDWPVGRNASLGSGSTSNSNNAPFLSAIFSLLVNNAHPLPSQPQTTERGVQPQPPPPLPAERVEEDNNNGDINGNNTGQIWVRPNSNNRAQQQPNPDTTTDQVQRPLRMPPPFDPPGSPPPSV